MWKAKRTTAVQDRERFAAIVQRLLRECEALAKKQYDGARFAELTPLQKRVIEKEAVRIVHGSRRPI